MSFLGIGRLTQDRFMNLASSMFNDLRYYNIISDIFEQDSNIAQCKYSRGISNQQRRVPPYKDWIKIITDVSRRYDFQSTTIRYIIKDVEARVIRTYNKKFGDCPILVAECETVREAIFDSY